MELLETSMGPVACDDRGEGHPIVLLPSGAHDHHDYDELRALPPARFRSISLDWPAHGASPAAHAPASAMRFADLAEEVVAELAPGGAVVVGNSVGGFSAARLALRRPELVRGLVIIDGGGFLGRPPQVRLFCWLMARPRFLRAIYPSFSALYMRARTKADRRARNTGIATTRRDPGLRAVAQLWSSFASTEHDLRSHMRAIRAPTLLLWGRRDPVIPLRVGRQLERAVPGSRLVVFDSGHVPYTTDPEGVAAQLVPFADSAFGESRSGARHERRPPRSTAPHTAAERPPLSDEPPVARAVISR
jgi:pimeloyl-ACP methyl ester carboxylesterase